jgi:peroxiredoxin
MTKIGKLLMITVVMLTLLSMNAGAAWGQKATQKEVPAEYGYVVKPGQQVPGFEMTLTDGKKVKMSELKGRVVMLQFTASWCGVCRKEMPHIEKDIWAKYRNNPEFALFGIDLDEPLDKVIKFGKEVGITYPLALDPEGKIFYTFAEKGAGVTRNVIVDKTGKIIFLTRLFKEEEFNQMRKVIDLAMKKD